MLSRSRNRPFSIPINDDATSFWANIESSSRNIVEIVAPMTNIDMMNTFY